MKRTVKPTSDIHRSRSIRNRMKCNALCYNKYLTEEYLSQCTNEHLLCLVHPSDRLAFAQKVNVPLKEPVILTDLK
jgi:hypothetical protein